MTNETKRRIQFYTDALPGMKARVFSALMILGIAMVTAVMSTYAWVTLSYSPEVSNITTTLSANGALEIALAKENGEMPDEFDIDESVGISTDIFVKNLAWGNLVNLSDERYGIENLALRPAKLNTASLLTNPLEGATYGADGRVDKMNTDFAFAIYDGSDFRTANNKYGVRSIASVTKTIADGTEAARQEKINDITNAHTAVNQAWNKVPDTFSAMGTMISKYAQDKLDDTNTNLAPYINNMIPLYQAVQTAMETQMGAYVALANFQNYMYAQNNPETVTYHPLTWEDIRSNSAAYNVSSATSESSNKIVSLVGLTQFISDYNKIVQDIGYLNQYYSEYKKNGTAYYWSSGGVSGHQLSNIVANLIDYSTMTIDLKGDGKEVAVTALSGDNASDLMKASGESRNVYTYNGIAIRFEQLAVDEEYRLNGRAACTIKVTKVLTITVYGKAYTKASGSCYYAVQAAKMKADLTNVANDMIAEDSYGLAIDLWLRCNAEKTCLTLEGATATDEQGFIMAYDGINRVWGSTGEANLTTDSTTQGGGSCYVYYADTPEDQERSLDLLESMKVAFVDSEGNYLATAEMDTVNYYAVNGRVTVPLVLDTNTKTTYEYENELAETAIGRAITTLYLDHPQRIMVIVYLDGTHLSNTNVLADAEIQGQLNIQFGSSENISTIGDNQLLTATRSVTASLSKQEMDFDNAVTDDDLTTAVIVNVEGTQPSKMTAFFLRAINPTQGSRESTMEFVRQEDGSWTSEYRFTSPGTYYLRHIRLDGVEYALSNSQKVEVSGFALRSVTWGEGMQTEVEVSTSDDSYSESVFVEFASSDRTKMPKTVQARFMRSDGNITNTDLSFNSSTGKWSGTASFTVSDTYKLRYLIFDNKQMDLSNNNWDKTLRLNLGMYVEVYNGTQSVSDEFEAGRTYSKDLSARIFNNAGTPMEAIEGAILYYSNGGSSTGTINTDLIWDEAEGAYTGELEIIKAGRYRFSSVTLGAGSTLTRCTQSPVYSIISPNPPQYNVSRSINTYYGITQFAPYTNDAVIDNLYIDDGEAATVRAIVYNADAVVNAAQSEEAPLQSGFFALSSETGEIYYTGENWCIMLPKYTKSLDSEGNALSGATFTQEGTWQLCALYVSDCYDSKGELRDADNPIIWVGTDNTSRSFAQSNELKSDATFDFSKLSTTVSCTLKVTMVSGTTALGSSSDAFMSRYPVSGIGMYALLTNNNNEVIPASKISDVSLSISYTPSSTSSQYGYKVQSGAAKNYDIRLNAQDEENGHRTVSLVNGASDADWQYVGVYQVNSLKVTLGGNTMTYTPSSGVGVPSQYTVTTAGPSSDNIELLDENIKQRNTILGRVGNSATGAVNGTFLQAQDPGVTAKITLTTEDHSDTQYVVLDDVTMQFVMNYKSGKTAPNGGYSWSGTSPYESVTINMTNNSGTYATSANTLLAGAYSTQLRATVGGETTTKTLNDVLVYSKKPSVTITAVSPATSTSFQMNTNNEAQYYTDAILVDVQNYLSADGKMANVYIKATSKTEQISEEEYADLLSYELPKVTLRLADAGTVFKSANLTVGNAADASYSNTYTFTPSSATVEQEIGGKTQNKVKASEDGDCVGGQTYYINPETQYAAGEQTIRSVTMTDSSDTAYAVDLTDAIVIRQPSSPPPSITYSAVSGYNSFAAVESQDGGSFAVTLPTAAQFGTTTSEIAEPMSGSGWGSPVKTTSTKYVYATKGSVKTNSVPSGCGTKTYYYYTYTYYKYTRNQYVYEQTTGTKFYNATTGLTGWNVGGTTYAPGATITVSGNVTAVPVIGQISKTFLREDTVTLVHTTYKDVSDGTGTFTQDKETYTTDAAAANATEYTTNQPSGYIWYSTTDRFDSSWVTTTETQLGQDYQKAN